MIKHCILLSSAYSIGKRIAMDFIYDDDSVMSKIKDVMDSIKNTCGTDVSLSSHFIPIDSREWKAVGEFDPFFQNVELIKTKEEFISLIMKDRTLMGTDVAKYILSKYSCTHLKLEKLTYLCYADYLCATDGDKLFNDKIYAYRLGPVVDSVYAKYKKYGYDQIEEPDFDSGKLIDTDSIHTGSSKSRIIASKDGIKKLISIDKTLDKYASLSASSLVKLTHTSSSPWSLSGSGMESNREIKDKTILQFHSLEI